MTKEEALEALSQGHTLTHDLMLPEEHVRLKGKEYIFEDGFTTTPKLFWHDRQGPSWQTGWKILN